MKNHVSVGAKSFALLISFLPLGYGDSCNNPFIIR
jgi:hypothetical protein